MKKRLDVIINNHMDLTWRRCFFRRFSNEGKTFVSYQDIEQYYIEDNLHLCELYPEYKFQIESVAVLQAYLKRKPQDKEKIKALHREGRLWVSGTGINIVDGNLPGGESIVRNFVLGQLYLRHFFGREPKLANREDAFGNCAQMPQILKGCGMNWVRGLSYSECKKDYWCGLDGSIVYTGMLPVSGEGGGWRKYAPCPECSGAGTTKQGERCVYCAGRGIDWKKQENDRQPIHLAEPCPNHGTVKVGGEEVVPDESVLNWMKQLDPLKFDARFALEEEQYELYEEAIRCAAPEAKDTYYGELNPNNTGCFVTRIKTKQLARRTEDQLLQLEALLVRAVQQGKTWPHQELQEMWESHLFTLFHDAVTATHIDAAYQELLDIWKGLHERIEMLFRKTWLSISTEAPGCYTVVNHIGFPYTGLCYLDLPQSDEKISAFVSDTDEYPVVEYSEGANGQRRAAVLIRGLSPYGSLVLTACNDAWQAPYAVVLEGENADGIEAGILRADDSVRKKVKSEAVAAIENECFKLCLSHNGVDEIWDKKVNRMVAGVADKQALVFYLEQDVGSPWATVLPGTQRMELTEYTCLKKIERHSAYQRAYYTVKLPQTLYGTINGVRLDFEVTLYAGLARVDVDAGVEWDNYNVRLRMGVRTAATGKNLYEVPYGVMEREPYAPSYGWKGAGGDWPTQGFFGVSGDWSLAVLNCGTPSCCIEKMEHGSELSVSLLRSPTMPTYLHEPDAYSMCAFDGMRDTGSHHFHLAIVSYECLLENAAVMADAHCFNCEPYIGKGILPDYSLLKLECPCAYISSVKQAENGDALVCRIVEYRGTGGKIKLYLPKDMRQFEKTSMLEDAVQRIPVNTDGAVEWEIHPFEIVTAKLF